MAKQREDVCPGCSRHCCAGSVRCKYGRKYFEKQKRTCGQKKGENERHYKWEEYVRRDGLLFRLLLAASASKRALRRKQLTEEKLLSVLEETERAQLEALLEKLMTAFE